MSSLAKSRQPSDAVAARLLLCVSKLDERFGCRVFDEQLGDDFGAVVGHGGFTVGLVQHLVEALRAKGALHQVTKRHGSRNKFLRDAHAACDRGRGPNDGDRGAPAAVVTVRHDARGGASCFSTLFGKKSLLLGRGFLRRWLLGVLAQLVLLLSLVV